MDPVKAQSAQQLKAPAAAQRPTQQSKPVTSSEASADKKPVQQSPKPTTNTRGETLGRHLNVTA